MSFIHYMKTRQQRVNDALQRSLPPQNTVPERLHQAMHYAVLNGGKRLRPLLVYATGEALGADIATLDIPACALELIHAYSLVHDDLPAMDDDDLRRGQPTCHKAFDEATAILVGDALQSLAFALLTKSDSTNLSAQARIQMVQVLANACGSTGMVGGQAMDIEANNMQPDLFYLEKMHQLKTGALICASIKLGALAANPHNKVHIQNLEQFANYMGLAFQIHDDVLDIEGRTDKLGKQQGKDYKKNKLTYPTLTSVEYAKTQVCHLFENAMNCLSALGDKAERLQQIAGFIIQRDY